MFQIELDYDTLQPALLKMLLEDYHILMDNIGCIDEDQVLDAYKTLFEYYGVRLDK